MKILAPKNDNEDIIDKQYVDTGLSGKQATLVSGTNIKTINNQSLLGSGNITIEGGGGSSTKTIDTSDSTQWDSEEDEPTQAVLQDIGANEYQIIALENIPLGDGVVSGQSLYLSLKVDAGDVHLRQYVRFEDGDEEEDEPTAIETWTIGNFDTENPTTYLRLISSHLIMQDLTINGNSILDNNTANLVTNSTYNATTNKIATMSDIPTDVEQRHSYEYSGKTYYYQFYGVKTIDNIMVNVGVEVDVVYATLLLINMDIERPFE